MNTIYAEGLLGKAVHVLTVGEGDIKERLNAAYMCFHPIGREDLPEEIRDDYDWIISKLTRKPALKAKYSDSIISGSVEQTLHTMKSKTAVSIVKRILHIRSRIGEYNMEESGE